MTTIPSLITRAALAALLMERRGATPISVVFATDPARSNMRRTNNPYMLGKGENASSSVRKVSKCAGMIGANYDKSVERRLAANINEQRALENLPPLEGEALAEAIDSLFRRGESWHEPIIAEGNRITCLSRNKNDNGLQYLRFVTQASSEVEFISVADVDAGETIPEERVKPFIPTKENRYDNQGLPEEDKVRFLAPCLDSIIDIKVGGELYRIADNFTQYPRAASRKLFAIAEQFVQNQRPLTKVG